MQPITTAHLAEINAGESMIVEDGEIGIVSDEELPSVLAAGGHLIADHAAITARLAEHGADVVAERLTAERAEHLIDRAVDAVREATVAAESAGLRRAEAVAALVTVCDGNQSEAARRLGIHQSRVNKLVAKVRDAHAAPPASSMA
jgi:alkylation response protein AidB-like acyl-CoA dehydrogenase